mgnify:CR=1 FL=1
MINFLSSWAEQIVLAVIVATIIELILPDCKNKKYIQMVIGIYILFNILSPLIKNKEVFLADTYNFEEYNIIQKSETNQKSMDTRIEKIYLEELEKEIISKFEENNFVVSKCLIDAELDTTKKNAGIHLITVKIKSPVDEKKVEKIKQEIVEELEIDLSKIKIQIN